MKKLYSVSYIVILLYIVSLTGTYLLSPSGFMRTDISIFNIIYLNGSLLLLINAWSSVRINKPIDLKINKFDISTYSVLKFIGFISLAINLYIIYLLSGQVTDFSSFKNGGEFEQFQNELPVPHIFQVIVQHYSSISLILIPYHFYFLSKNRKKEALFSLLVSLNFVFYGLAIFSRSTTITYLLIYIIFYFINNGSLSDRIKKYYRILALSTFSLFIFALGIITINRFSGENEVYVQSLIYNDTLVSDPVSASLLSYLSQWYIYAANWLNNYQFEPLGGKLSFPLYHLIVNRLFGIETSSELSLQQLVINYFKHDTGAFLGVSTYMLNDLGYAMSTIIFVTYYKYVKSISTKINYISVQMIMITLLRLPCMGIFSSALNNIGFHITLILTLILWFNSRQYRYYK